MLCYLQDCHLQPIFGLETAVFGCSFMTYTISILQFVADLFPVLKSTQSTVLTIHHSPGDGKSSPNNTRPSHPRDRNKRQPSVFIGRAHDMIRRWKTQEFLKSWLSTLPNSSEYRNFSLVFSAIHIELYSTRWEGNEIFVHMYINLHLFHGAFPSLPIAALREYLHATSHLRKVFFYFFGLLTQIRSHCVRYQ